MKRLRALFVVIVALQSNFVWSATGLPKKIVPDYEVMKTKNGVPVYFFKSEQVPIFEVLFSFSRGADYDPVGQTGLALFTTQMLSHGAGGMSENTISIKFDDLAGSFNFSVGEERTAFSIGGLNEQAGPILDLFFTILKQPDFPQPEFERVKRNVIDQIQQIRDNPGAMATHVASLLVLDGTAKGRPTSGFLRDLRLLSTRNLKEFLPEFLRPDLLRVLVVGGSARSEIADRVIEGIESWNCPKCGNPVMPPPYPTKPKAYNPNEIVVLDRPGVDEAHVRMVFLGPARNNPEFFELEVAESVLSGPFNSRLNQKIREQQGLTYSVSAGFNYSDTMSTFLASASTKTSSLSKLLKQMHSELARFSKADDITEEELTAAKNYLVGSFPLQLHHRYAIARMFFASLLSGLPNNFIDQYPQKLDDVSLEDLKKAVRKHFRGERMLTVVVGDLKKVELELTRAGFKFRRERIERFL